MILSLEVSRLLLILLVAYQNFRIVLGAGDPQGAPSAPAAFVDAAPLHAIPDPMSVSSPLATANADASLEEGDDVVVPKEAVVSTGGLNDVFDVDVSGRVHVAESVLVGDEHNVFVSSMSHAVAAPVKVALAFDAIEEWLAKMMILMHQCKMNLPS
ncbi:hypothetical protein V6N11_039693 [Hibiscus sabdariffa]|uniref:Secreted protein n=1 Tax=Hibiscus sabdariffa TaxID=183260 RepID=A0ABR1ZZU9_9ROSI